MDTEAREEDVESTALVVGELAERAGGLLVAVLFCLVREDRQARAGIELRAQRAEKVPQRGVGGIGPAKVAEPPQRDWIIRIEHASTVVVGGGNAKVRFGPEPMANP
jgi:hypothetical protein